MSEHRHYWTEAEDDRWACTDCDETCASCIECKRWTDGALLICQRCVTCRCETVSDTDQEEHE